MFCLEKDKISENVPSANHFYATKGMGEPQICQKKANAKGMHPNGSIP